MKIVSVIPAAALPEDEQMEGNNAPEKSEYIFKRQIRFVKVVLD